MRKTGSRDRAHLDPGHGRGSALGHAEASQQRAVRSSHGRRRRPATRKARQSQHGALADGGHLEVEVIRSRKQLYRYIAALEYGPMVSCILRGHAKQPFGQALSACSTVIVAANLLAGRYILASEDQVDDLSCAGAD